MTSRWQPSAPGREPAARPSPSSRAAATASKPANSPPLRGVTASLASSEGHFLPTLSAALLARAAVPAMPVSVLLAPATPLETIPAYRLVDVLRGLDRCPTAIKEAFSGKIVLIGSNLPEEDRKRTPDRFLSPAPALPEDGGECSLDRLGASDPGSGTTPGVFVHAAAVQSVLPGHIVGALPTAGPAAHA